MSRGHLAEFALRHRSQETFMRYFGAGAVATGPIEVQLTRGDGAVCNRRAR